MNKKEIISKILLALHAADGQPVPEAALLRSVQVLSRPEEPTIGDVLDALKTSQTQQFVDGITDELTETRYALLPKGKAKARQL